MFLHELLAFFSARGYNIESLTVAQVNEQKGLSRITVITTGTIQVITQIKNQLNRLVCVHSVADLTEKGPVVEREIALFKVKGTGDLRIEALRMADAFRARVVDATSQSFVFELTGSPSKLDAFAKLMQPIGLIDISRAGVVAISRGIESLDDLT